MHVGLITYQTGHLKTYQMMQRLMTKGFRVSLFAFPFVKRPKKTETTYQDRPAQLIDYDVERFCSAHNVEYKKINGWSPEDAVSLGSPGHRDTPDIFLHCIAKIIPKPFIDGRKILNCHPGLLPENRGVDAFKWCVVNGWPFGVTLHIIDEAIDRGTILYRMRVPVLPNDVLASVCQRAYDLECDLLANVDYHLGNARFAWSVGDDYPISHRRIPSDLDASIEQLFLDRRDLFVSLSAIPDPQVSQFGTMSAPR